MFMRSCNRSMPRTTCGWQEDHNLQSTQVCRAASQSDRVSLNCMSFRQYLIFWFKVTTNSVICFCSGRYDRVCSSPCIIPFCYSRRRTPETAYSCKFLSDDLVYSSFNLTVRSGCSNQGCLWLTQHPPPVQSRRMQAFAQPKSFTSS